MLKNQENHEHLRIQIDSHENQEKLRIPFENHKKHENNIGITRKIEILNLQTRIRNSMKILQFHLITKKIMQIVEFR